MDRLGQIRCIGRCAAQNGRAEILHELQLPIRVAGGHRQRQAAELLAAAVEAEAAGEQAVAVGDLADVFRSCARGRQRSCAAVVPEVDILLGVEGDDALAGRAGGGVDADTFFQRLRKQTEGVCIPQIRLAQKRELIQIVAAVDILRRDALFLHLRAVVGDLVPDVPDLTDQTLILPGLDLFLTRTFDFFLIIPFHGFSL